MKTPKRTTNLCHYRLLLLFFLACRVARSDEICIADPSVLPLEWRAPENFHFKDSGGLWTTDEQKASDAAVMNGLREMSHYLSKWPHLIMTLYYTSVEAFLDMTYGSPQMEELQRDSFRIAAEHLEAISAPYFSLLGHNLNCHNSIYYLSFSTYAHSLAERQPQNERIKAIDQILTKRANEALSSCGTLENFLGYHPDPLLDNLDAGMDHVSDRLVWASTFVDALTNPAVRMMDGTHRYIADIWTFLAQYPIPTAKDHEQGFYDDNLYNIAYAVVGAANARSGKGRHLLSVSDAPWLFKYVRENFYAVMELGEMDLVALFVGILRQYGCTEMNDAQLRHGTRFVMNLYESAGQSWMAHYEPWQIPGNCTARVSILKASNAVFGLRPRVFEPVLPGSYEYIFRKILREYV